MKVLVVGGDVSHVCRNIQGKIMFYMESTDYIAQDGHNAEAQTPFPMAIYQEKQDGQHTHL